MKFSNVFVIFILVPFFWGCSSDDNTGGGGVPAPKMPVNAVKFTSDNAAQGQSMAQSHFDNIDDIRDNFSASSLQCMTIDPPFAVGMQSASGNGTVTLNNCEFGTAIVNGLINSNWEIDTRNSDLTLNMSGNISLDLADDTISISELNLGFSVVNSGVLMTTTISMSFALSSEQFGGFIVQSPVPIQTIYNSETKVTTYAGEMLITGADDTRIRITTQEDSLKITELDASGTGEFVPL